MAASTWNNAGTWEDKNVTVPGLELLVEALSGISAEAQVHTLPAVPSFCMCVIFSSTSSSSRVV